MRARHRLAVPALSAVRCRLRRAAEAAPPGPAELRVTVTDPTGAALVTATVTVTDAAGVPQKMTVNGSGVARLHRSRRHFVSRDRRSGGVRDVRGQPRTEEGHERDRRSTAARGREGRRHRPGEHAGPEGERLHELAVRAGDRRAARRSRRARAGADADGRPGRDHAGERVQGRTAAAEITDPPGAVPHELVRGRQSRGWRLRHRHHHEAGNQQLARTQQHRLPRRIAERPQLLRADPRPGAVSPLRLQCRRSARQGKDVDRVQPGWQPQLRLADDRRRRAGQPRRARPGEAPVPIR